MIVRSSKWWALRLQVPFFLFDRSCLFVCCFCECGWNLRHLRKHTYLYSSYCFSILFIQSCFLIESIETSTSMGNSESSPDDTYEDFSHQPAAPGGYSVDSSYRPQSPEHSRRSTHANHQHHPPPAQAGTSVNTINRKIRHSAHIADNFDSLEEVSFSLVFLSTSCRSRIMMSLESC